MYPLLGLLSALKQSLWTSSRSYKLLSRHKAWEVWSGHCWHPLLWQTCVSLLCGTHSVGLFSATQQSQPHPSLTDWHFVVVFRCPPHPACGEDFSSPYLWGRFADWLGRSWWTPSEGRSFFLSFISAFLPPLSSHPNMYKDFLVWSEKLFCVAC